MRILLIMDPGIPVPPPLYGGHERMVHLFATEYHRLGHNVTLLAGPGSSCDGTTIAFGRNDLKRGKAQRAAEVFSVWKYLAAHHHEYDLIHNFGRLIYLLPVLNKPVRKIMSYGRRVTPRGIRIMNMLPNKNMLFTACSDYCVNTGNVAGNWKTIYNAIDFKKYRAVTETAGNAPLVFLSRLDKIKGPDAAIRVALQTGSKLIIAGNKPSTADNIAYYQTQVEPFIDQEQIVYVGEVNDSQKNELLGQARGMLFPLCGEEAFGLVMIEAMACGTPVIAYRHAAAPEVIDDGLTGYLVDTEQEMADAIARLPLIDRKKCRQLAESRFDVSVIAAEYLGGN